MRDSAPVVPSLPRPGRMMKVVLATIAVVSIVGAIVHNWAPGGEAGRRIWDFFTCDPVEVFGRFHVWTLLTSGVLTSPTQLSHLLFTLLGLYFLTPQLERNWGGARLLRLLLVSVLVGNLTVLAVDRAPIEHPIFHPRGMYGAGAAIAAVAVAWSREYAYAQIRLFFVLPVSGRALFWLTIGFCVFGLVYYQSVPEGAMAPFGGLAVGLAMGGNPSPARALWLRVKLALLRRRGPTLTVESLTGEPPRPRPGAKRGGKGGPPLRVVHGGLDDELEKRKPPKDKRFLN